MIYKLWISVTNEQITSIADRKVSFIQCVFINTTSEQQQETHSEICILVQ